MGETVLGTSLPTSRDTSSASGLAVNRSPTAPNGFVKYSRTITLSDAAADDVLKATR